MKNIFFNIIAIVGFVTLSVSQMTLADVTAEQAESLNTELTPLGGEKAGNADGTIPDWEGGYTQAPSGYKTGDPRPDPFPNEKVSFTITANNMEQYADKLDEGQLYLLQKYPDYKMNVYPTHRTASAPEWVYKETFKNATRTKLNGYEVVGAYGGVPFPIPQSGLEVMWNHELRIRPSAYKWPFNSWVIDSSGNAEIASSATNEISVPYYIEGGDASKFDGKYFYNLQTVTGPAYRAGELLMYYDKLDNTRSAWQYLVGQRRVRRAPTVCCDTPNFVNSGIDFFDQVLVFFGPKDRYDWKIISKKEMYIPYNMNAFYLQSDKEVIGKKYPNPEHIRWELHRVWEIEGTLRDGQRDVRPKRKIYIDEDSWIAVLGNTWDAQGTLWHTSIGFPLIMFELPSLNMENWATIDFINERYTISIVNDQEVQLKNVQPYPDTYYTPDGMSRKGIR